MNFLAGVVLACAYWVGAASNSDDLSLLQHSLSWDKGAIENDTVYHLHIPKCAGISFGQDALGTLSRAGVKMASREGCLEYGVHNKRIKGTAVMLRDPRKHVLSQFDFCWAAGIKPYVDSVHPRGAPKLPKRFEDWVRAWVDLKRGGWHGNFTPTASLVSGSFAEISIRHLRISAWGMPPFSPEPRLLNPQDWPLLDGGGTIWHSVHVPYQCYSPISLQAQRLTCNQQPLDYRALPSGELAIAKMESTWFVGLVEAYQASMCLLEVKLGHDLPAYCHCSEPELWETFEATDENHNQHRIDIEDFPSEVIELVDELTDADRQLYKAARARFLREITEVEKEHRTHIVCNELRRKLES